MKVNEVYVIQVKPFESDGLSFVTPGGGARQTSSLTEKIIREWAPL